MPMGNLPVKRALCMHMCKRVRARCWEQSILGPNATGAGYPAGAKAREDASGFLRGDCGEGGG